MPTIEELLTELEQPEYAGLTTAEKAAALNEQDQEYHVAVGTAEVQNYLMTTVSSTPPLTLYMKLSLTYRDNNYPAIVRAVAESAIDLANGQIQQLELYDNPMYGQMVGVLVQAGVWTQAEADAVIHLGMHYRSRAEELWGVGTEITEAEVRVVELQPKVMAVTALAQWVAQGYGRALHPVQLIQNRLANGEDVTEEEIPTKDQLAALFRGE